MKHTRIFGTPISVILAVSFPHNVKHTSYDKKKKFFVIYSCPAQPDFQNLSAVYFSFHCTDKVEFFSQNFKKLFFLWHLLCENTATREYISTCTNHLLSMTHSTTKCLSHASALMNRSIMLADSIKEIRIIFSSNLRHD
jgi:hypothetical protein